MNLQGPAHQRGFAFSRLFAKKYRKFVNIVIPMQVKGATTLFKELFYDEAPVVTMKPRKGRNDELNNLRNECLISRYYYTGRENPKISYDALIKDIAAQFFISTFTVHDVLQDNYSFLFGLKKENPGKAYFVKKWPHLVW